MMQKILDIIGFASELGTTIPGGSQGPKVLQDSPFQEELGLTLRWQQVIEQHSASRKLEATDELCHYCSRLAALTATHTRQQHPFVVVGGDHSCALGTWSGVAAGSTLPLGLIWIDAHLDCHTDQSSKSHNIHGMPAAALLGVGDPRLTSILTADAKLKANNLVYIGIRSFEQPERRLLEEMGAKIFYMHDVKQLGFANILQQAVHYLQQRNTAIGITLDLDAIDPQDAPAVATHEDDGIRAAEVITGFANLPADIVALEIAEFTPRNDVQHKTEKLVFDLIKHWPH